MLTKKMVEASRLRCEFTQTVRDGKSHISFKSVNSPFYDHFRDIIHDGMLPDNFIYTTTYAALTAIEEGLTDEYLLGIEPDIYNADLLVWAGSHTSRVEYIEEALGYASDGHVYFFDILREAQGREIEEITQAVLSFVEQQVEEEAERGDDYEL
jgi:hypothetical protein